MHSRGKRLVSAVSAKRVTVARLSIQKSRQAAKRTDAASNTAHYVRLAAAKG